MTDTMLAGRLDLEKQHFEVTEVPIPEPSADEVRISVKAAGVCLSDLHLIDGTLTVANGGTVTLGHEVSGVIESIGADVPTGLTVEYLPWLMPLFKEVPMQQNGELAMPTAPGLGLEFDQATIDRYRV